MGGDLGNSMVSRVPATLATCPCHSPETPSGPCFPLSVPVQALLHGKVGSMPTSLLGQKTSTGLPQGPRDPRIPLVISTLPPTPTPVPGAFSVEKGKTTYSSILAWRIPWTVYLWVHKELGMTE